MAVITVSRQFGSYGDAIARDVASALGYDFVDKEGIVGAARFAQQGIEVAAPTDAVNFLTEWYAQQKPSFFPPELCYYELPEKAFAAHSWQNDREFSARQSRKRFFQTTIQLLWKRGNIVIVGRGSNLVLKDEPDVLRVRLTAPLATRVHRTMRAEQIRYEEAMDTVVETDSLRTRYVYETYRRHIEEETFYDLMLGTERVDKDTATDLIVAAVKGVEARLLTQVLRADRLWV